MPTKAEKDRAVKLYTETRLPVGEIAASMGVSRSTVHRWLSAAGINHRGAMGPRDVLTDLGDDASADRFASIMAEFGRLHAEHDSTRSLVIDLVKTVAELKGALDAHTKQMQDYTVWHRADAERRDERMGENRELLEMVRDMAHPPDP